MKLGGVNDESARFVVIVGAARSGTKFLRDIIAESQACAAIPYDVNYVWKTGNQRLTHDQLAPESVAETTRATIVRNLTRLARTHYRRSRHDEANWPVDWIVEKTVSNGLRIPFVRHVLPHAKIIHLVRDGIDVVESSYRQWHEPSSQQYLREKLRYVPFRNYDYLAWYAWNSIRGKVTGNRPVEVWGVRYPGIDEDLRSLNVAQICARQWEQCVAATIRDLRTLPDEDKLEIRFEELMQSVEPLEEIADFLGLPDGNELCIRSRQQLRQPPAARWSETFDGETIQQILDVIQPLRTRLGYSNLVALPSQSANPA